MNKKLKKLQFNFTNINQSKQLMKLGVPVDTADFIMYNDAMAGEMCMLQRPHFLTEHGIKSVTFTKAAEGYENISIPSWSAGRLTEILDICFDKDRVDEYVRIITKYGVESNKSQISLYIKVFKECIKLGLIDFEKLYK